MTAATRPLSIGRTIAGIRCQWSLVVVWLVAGTILPAYMVGMWWLDRWSLGVAFDAYLAWGRVLANAAFGLTLMLLIAAVSRRVLGSILSVSAGHALLYLASATKLRSLGLPVILQDIHFIGAVDPASFHLLWQYLDTSREALAAALAAVGAIACLVWLEPPWCRKRSPWRALALAGSACLLASLYLATWPWTTHWYSKPQVRPSPLSSTPAALHGGLVVSMVYYHGVQRQRVLEVDSVALQDAFSMVASTSAGSARTAGTDGERPDVVVVLSESFMDPHILKGMQGMPDLIPALRREIVAGNGGMMRAPTYGGGTVRTEFEVLTGMPVAAFPDAAYPYVDLNPGVLPGIVSALEKQGYASLALHGNSGAFWNRANTYEAMGIDRFLTQRDLLKAGGRLDGNWLSDRSMTDILLGELRRSTRPTVAIAVSIENHGPYEITSAVRAPSVRAAIQLPPGLDPAAAAEMRNYLYHLRNADREFDRLLAGLRARGRPFVLLFFGDHMPALTGGAYDQLGFVDGGGPREQLVPWVLVTHGRGALRGSLPATCHAWHLPALAMAAAGVDEDGWFEFLAKVGARMEAEGNGPAGVRLANGLNAGAVARLQDRFDDHAPR
jgi:Sulfatase